MTARVVNLVNHRRVKPGVTVELFVDTGIPLDAELYGRIADVIRILDALFEDIPAHGGGAS